MADRFYSVQTGIVLLGVISAVFGCSCKPNLRADACKSDYVIVAKVLGERQMTSQNGMVSNYDLNVTNVLKTSDQYEGAEKIIQAKAGAPAGCEVLLQKDHTYIFSGHVVEFDEEGTTKKVLEVKYCNYVDLKEMAMNKELFDDIMDMIENPPTCAGKRRIMRAEKMNDPDITLGSPRQSRWGIKKWNHPFQKRWSNPFQKRWGNPFQKRWSNPFQKRWGNPFQKRWSNPFQKRWGSPFQRNL